MNGAVAARAFVLAAVLVLSSSCQDLTPRCCFAGRLISQEVLDNDTYLATVDRTADEVWSSTKVAVRRAAPTRIDFQDGVRRAVVEVDHGEVTAEVRIYERYWSTLRVSATRFGVDDGELARRVYDRILDEIEK